MDAKKHYDVQIQRVDVKWRAICGNERVDATGGDMMCNLKGQIGKGLHYDMQLVDAKRGALLCAN